MDAYLVSVEVDMAFGMPGFSTVGLAEGAVRESKIRVLAAIKNSFYKLPGRKITVNLAPADIRKDGTAFDLPIAIGLLKAAEIITDEKSMKDFLFVGEWDGFLLCFVTLGPAH